MGFMSLYDFTIDQEKGKKASKADNIKESQSTLRNQIRLSVSSTKTLTLLGRGWLGVWGSAHTFFKRPFLHEKRGLEVPNFVTFPYSL